MKRNAKKANADSVLQKVLNIAVIHGYWYIEK